MKRKRGLLDLGAPHVEPPAGAGGGAADELSDVNDAGAAVHVLLGSFVGVVPRAPTLAQSLLAARPASAFQTLSPIAVATLSQIRGVLGPGSAHTVDAELAALAALERGAPSQVRLVRAPRDGAVVLGRDLDAYIVARRAGAAAAGAAAAGAPLDVHALDFFHFLLGEPEAQEQRVSHMALAGVWARWTRAGRPPCDARGGATGAAAAPLHPPPPPAASGGRARPTAAVASGAPTLADAVGRLLRLGALARRTEATRRTGLGTASAGASAAAVGGAASMAAAGSTIPVLAAGDGMGAWEDAAGGGGGGGGAAGAAARPAPPTAAAVSPPSSEDYWFSVPESGGLWAALDAGRSELLGRVRARRYGEVPLAEAEGWRLSRSPLGARAVVRDALGAGALVVVRTAAGAFLRLPGG